MEEHTDDIIMFYAERQNAETLIPLIVENVERGSIIVSDGWAAYRQISNYMYLHEVDIHEKKFVLLLQVPTHKGLNANGFTLNINDKTKMRNNFNIITIALR